MITGLEKIKDHPNYKPTIEPNRTYSGPDVPIAYDQNWQYFTNLTKDQIAWFQAQPEWANFKAYVALSPKTATVGVPTAVVNAALQAVGQPLAVSKNALSN